MASRGSTLFRLTWKERVTPSLRRICALRASAPRTDDNGSSLSLWPTPTSRDHKDGACVGTVPINGLLGRAVWMASWSTPQCADVNLSRYKQEAAVAKFEKSPYVSLALQAQVLAGWGTPTATTPGGTPEQQQQRKRRSQERGCSLGDSVTALSLQVQLVDSGETPTGSPAPTGSIGQLNPAHSRWLMGLPLAWDACAPTATRSSRKSQRRSSAP